MAFLSFGSKKGKVQKMLEESQFELLLQEAVKDKKIRRPSLNFSPRTTRVLLEMPC